MERLLRKSSAVVPKLVSDLFGKGYKSFVDNWYARENLFRNLEENSIATCGRARTNWLQLPKSFKKEPLQKGQHKFSMDGNTLMMCFHDKKEIYLLSTIHSMEEVASGKSDKDRRSVNLLQLIFYYNENVECVDKNDAMVWNYNCVRKSYKWTTKLFFHFIEEAVFNSFLLYKKCGGKKRFLKIKMILIKSILWEAHIDVDNGKVGHNKYVGHHFPELIPPTESKDKP